MRSLVLLAGLMGATACITPNRPPVPQATLWDMSQDLEPLRTEFNAHQNAPRLVALVPPSCAESVAAFQEARGELEALGPGQDLVWLVVWQDELPEDDCDAARAASQTLDRQRTEFFHDCKHLAGRSFANGTVLAGELRRAFLFYPPGVAWGENPPAPSAWVHRTGRVGLDHRGDARDLAAKLRERWTAVTQVR
ncbi:MAG: hypothetical protein H6830_05585 [Planctomycetes bacterium]|nr:hypothetical protein [Planctomycetota bacterium]MCB9908993.1 hypothetical protein [Planctomycetota bacterium]MCB9911760.1 hypothetical protein [Planctomycetota bacterium]HPF15674.1 hypothetical protein [Planctomycetota bacterium]HRV82832.1 hypothetical protein [Planctomycetota bacterium]